MINRHIVGGTRNIVLVGLTVFRVVIAKCVVAYDENFVKIEKEIILNVWNCPWYWNVKGVPYSGTLNNGLIIIIFKFS